MNTRFEVKASAVSTPFVPHADFVETIRPDEPETFDGIAATMH